MTKRTLFFITWGSIGVLYLTGLAVFGVVVGGATLNGALLMGLLRPKVLVFASVIALLMATPVYQYLMSRKVRTSKRSTAARLWVWGVPLGSLVGIALLFYSYSYSMSSPGDTIATSLPTSGLATTTPRTYHAPDLPKYGGIEKNDEQRAADVAYMTAMLAQHGSLDVALDAELQMGWDAFARRDEHKAMQSFNHAWLLSATSSGALHGMGLIEGVRGHFASSITLLEEARTLAPDNGQVSCDLALSYLNQGNTSNADASVVRALELGVRTPLCYKTAAKVARAVGDESRAQTYEAALPTSTERE